ncbi:MAG: hypothetical protein RBG13Loki_3764 [Promethearchaeota archaeon CR_4]|nr:MAG: hypothetical protein RBG13Loki_3764 [Candidatus Lokiarchaeota archaeon CR_4]
MDVSSVQVSRGASFIVAHYFSLTRNFEGVLLLSPSEIATIERVSTEFGLPVNIEQIANGTIVYVGEDFSRERLLQIRNILFQQVDVLNPENLPARYWEWYDSFTNERFYFKVAWEKIEQVISVLFRSFLRDKRASDILPRISERVPKNNE